MVVDFLQYELCRLKNITTTAYINLPEWLGLAYYNKSSTMRILYFGHFYLNKFKILVFIYQIVLHIFCVDYTNNLTGIISSQSISNQQTTITFKTFYNT